MHSDLAQIKFQLAWDRLISVVEEQARALVRTAFGTATREAGDVSAGYFSMDGRMLAQAVTGTPGHVNSMANSVRHFLTAFPEMKIGDVYITNDPWKGTGHLYDVTVVTPAFYEERPLGLFANTVHLVDIGGRGVPGEARQVYEEGLYIPIMKLVDAGTLNQSLLVLMRANVREPIQVIGDIYSQIACNNVGNRRLNDMMRDCSLADTEELAAFIFERTRNASLAAIRALPRGTYSAAMTVDGLDAPIELKAALKINTDGIDVDFSGTSGLSRLGYNVPLCYTEAYAAFGIKCIVAPEIPNNYASLELVRVTAPENCILNALPPAPVAARSLIGHMIPDVIFGCLAQIFPDRVPAESTSCLWNVRLMGGFGRVSVDAEALRNATPFNITAFHSGGTGARPNKDGLSATAFPSGVKNVQVEMTEAIAPVVFWRKEYRSDSGGAGEFRGGLGQVIEVGSRENAPIAVAAVFDRIDYPARGRSGGMSGAAGTVSLKSGRILAGKGHHTINPGDRLVLQFPGGGGFGDPACRDREKLARDIRYGLVSQQAAGTLYGYASQDEA